MSVHATGRMGSADRARRKISEIAAIIGECRNISKRVGEFAAGHLFSFGVKMRITPLAAGLLLFAMAGVSEVRAHVLHDEGVSGDLSTDPLAPTALSLSEEGTHSIIATLRTSSAADNRDWVAVTVPADHQIIGLTQISYTSGDNTSFTGFNTGATFTGALGDPASYAGYTHFGLG